jgi:esterase/lipase
MSKSTVLSGCEPMSYDGSRDAGVLVIHGFTGNPSSLRVQADAFAELGYHVELPRLPGHGTTIDDMIVAPGIGSDIADPDATEIAYDGTPLLSLSNEGIAPIVDRYGELAMPILLYTSTNDHVVPPAASDHLAATAGGAVEHVLLERSFHVATQDYDAANITAGAATFIARVAGA